FPVQNRRARARTPPLLHCSLPAPNCTCCKSSVRPVSKTLPLHATNPIGLLGAVQSPPGGAATASPPAAASPRYSSTAHQPEPGRTSNPPMPWPQRRASAFRFLSAFSPLRSPVSHLLPP